VVAVRLAYLVGAVRAPTRRRCCSQVSYRLANESFLSRIPRSCVRLIRTSGTPGANVQCGGYGCGYVAGSRPAGVTDAPDRSWSVNAGARRWSIFHLSSITALEAMRGERGSRARRDYTACMSGMRITALNTSVSSVTVPTITYYAEKVTADARSLTSREARASADRALRLMSYSPLRGPFEILAFDDSPDRGVDIWTTDPESGVSAAYQVKNYYRALPSHLVDVVPALDEVTSYTTAHELAHHRLVDDPAFVKLSAVEKDVRAMARTGYVPIFLWLDAYGTRVELEEPQEEPEPPAWRARDNQEFALGRFLRRVMILVLRRLRVRGRPVQEVEENPTVDHSCESHRMRAPGRVWHRDRPVRRGFAFA